MNRLATPILIAPFLCRNFASAPNLGLVGRLRLVRRFRANHRIIPTASHWLEHLHMAAEILDIPADVDGCVVECGCFKGGSSANLSLACEIAGRRLVVCDSFAGLPAPGEHDKIHRAPLALRVTHYEEGQYRGRLDEVTSNVARHGSLDACEFVEGYFETTLPDRVEPLVLAFVDVDLHDSLVDCLLSIWPRLQAGCRLYSHEAQDLDFVARFFDTGWWRKHFGTRAPGFVGAGSGLPVQRIGHGSSLGYTTKGWDLPADR